MASTTRITVTLPTEQVEEIKRHSDNVSGDEELAQARAELASDGAGGGPGSDDAA